MCAEDPPDKVEISLAELATLLAALLWWRGRVGPRAIPYIFEPLFEHHPPLPKAELTQIALEWAERLELPEPVIKKLILDPDQKRKDKETHASTDIV